MQVTSHARLGVRNTAMRLATLKTEDDWHMAELSVKVITEVRDYASPVSYRQLTALIDSPPLRANHLFLPMEADDCPGDYAHTLAPTCSPYTLNTARAVTPSVSAC